MTSAHNPLAQMNDRSLLRTHALIDGKDVAGDSRFAAVAPFVPPEDEQTDFERYYIDSKPIGRLSVQKA